MADATVDTGQGDPGPTLAVPAVREFYKALHFNARVSVKQHVAEIRGGKGLEMCHAATSLISRKSTVLDVGCGVGWFACGVARRHGCRALGIDFNPAAIAEALKIARALNVPARFEVADLFRYQAPERFDMVVSLGVLHHTLDCHEGIRRLCNDFVRPGGHIFIGLYHRHGREPFLDNFREMMGRGASREEMFHRYRELHSWLGDEVHAESWFRDQVLHPHESLHTLEDVVPVL